MNKLIVIARANIKALAVVSAMVSAMFFVPLAMADNHANNHSKSEEQIQQWHAKVEARKAELMAQLNLEPSQEILLQDIMQSNNEYRQVMRDEIKEQRKLLKNTDYNPVSAIDFRIEVLEANLVFLTLQRDKIAELYNSLDTDQQEVLAEFMAKNEHVKKKRGHNKNRHNQ